MRLSHRLTLSLSILTLVTLAVSFGVVYVLVSREQVRDLDAALRTEAGAVSALIGQSSEIKAGLEVRFPVADALKNVESYAIVYDDMGQPLAWTRRSLPNPPAFDALRVKLPLVPAGTTFNYLLMRRPLRCIVIPITAGPARRLFVAISRAGLDDDMAYLLRLFATLMVAAMLSTIATATWVGRHVSSGVKRVADVARVVATGNFEARVTGKDLGSTEVESLAADLNHMISKLDELVSAHKVFASYAAHELRSPLAAMRGELQLALRRRRSIEEYEQVLASTLEDVEGLTSLAEDLLMFARVQGSSVAAHESAKVTDVVREAVRLAAGVAQMHNIEIVIAPHDEGWEIAGRAADLSRALRNLLENAVAHSPDQAKVTVEVMAVGNKVQLAVTDEGPGVALDDLSNVFQPFFRSSRNPSRNQSGAGLGLAIARGVVESNNGSIWVDTRQAQGARFIIELPKIS